MKLTNKEIFWKCWLWSIIGGIVVAVLFWMISGIGNLFHGTYGGTIFIDLLLGLSIVGAYGGAGLVGWRIADKYYHDVVKQFLKRYLWYSAGSFVVLVGVVYSPASFLAILWSLLAPFCVIWALNKTTKGPKVEPPQSL